MTDHVIIGAGMGGLATAIRLATRGLPVTVIERHSAPGGRARQVPSIAGNVDAGPTVLTMRWVFDALFEEAGTALEDHVTLHPQELLARHWWPDGSSLDLFAEADRSVEAVHAFAGATSAKQFQAFSQKARSLFEAFDAPLMQAAKPSILGLTARVLANPSVLGHMSPLATLAKSLARDFEDPRLQQLFGRYATYVGGSPYQSPAVLALIWQAEAAGVHVVKGGMHQLARAMEKLAKRLGVTFKYGCHVQGISRSQGGGFHILTPDQTIRAQTITFNGDPRALATGALGPDTRIIAPQTLKTPRSLSANVWSFGAQAVGPRAPELAHHNVFFCASPEREFSDLKNGQMPGDPTLYVCAEDRGTPAQAPQVERFEIIMNAPALGPDGSPKHNEDDATCQTRTFRTLATHGLTFAPTPEAQTALTRPQGFNSLFPQTLGSLYGQSPHGMMAAFQRPQAKTQIPGLYLCGGGTHPGAGVPMSALSGKHAAEAILKDQTLISKSRQTAMPGGTSMPSPTTENAPSR